VNEYDMKLAEDEETNRMMETLELFEDIMNEKFLKEIPTILFLNKSDLFREKIARVDLKGIQIEYYCRIRLFFFKCAFLNIRGDVIMKGGLLF
jgi:cytochrome c oxidase assembly factor CtaG